MRRYGFTQFYSVIAVEEVGWDWHRQQFIDDTRREALRQGYPSPPEGDPALELTYWRWSADKGVYIVAPNERPHYVRVAWHWEAP